MKERKIDSEGRIIVKKKTQPVEKESLPDQTIIYDDAGEDFGEQPKKLPQIAEYDFAIKCTTMAAVGIDMEAVCQKCPYKVEACMDTHIIPTITQKKDIARILRMSQTSGDDT